MIPHHNWIPRAGLMDSPAVERSSLRLRCVTAHVLMQRQRWRVELTKAYRCTKDMSLSLSSPKPHRCLSPPWSKEHERTATLPFCLLLFLHAAPPTVCDPEVWHFPSSPQVSVTQPGALARCPPPYLSQEGTKEGCRARISSSALPDCVTPADTCTPAEPRGKQEARGFTADPPFHLDCLYEETRLRSSPPLCP